MQKACMGGELRYPGKVVIVTGGTRGIGEACVREFVCQGSRVVFCALECERERGEALQRELQECGYPGEAYFVVCDVSNEADIKNLVSETVKICGRIDALVNNAGIFPPTKAIDDVTVEEFKCVLNVNVVAYFLTAKFALPYIRKTRGSIVNISSISALIGFNNAISYTTSKGAIAALSKALALDESKYGVRVNSVLPGNIDTPMWRRVVSEAPDPQARTEEGINQQPLGRIGTPQEVALAVLFLVADATFSQGSDLLLTGGADLGFGLKNEQPDAKDGVKGIKG